MFNPDSDSDPIKSMGEEIEDEAPSPLDYLIALEEELGCSIVEALTFYRDYSTSTRFIQMKTPQDLISQLDIEYRQNPLLMLRGTVTFRAARLAGMYLMKSAGMYKAAHENMPIAAAIQFVRHNPAATAIIPTLDLRNEQDTYEHGADDDAQGRVDQGLQIEDMWDTLESLVMYANHLNYELQDVVDPTHRKRANPSFKAIGVYFTQKQNLGRPEDIKDSTGKTLVDPTTGEVLRTKPEGWAGTIELVARFDDDLDAIQKVTNYAEYEASVKDPAFLLSEKEWNEVKGENIYDTFSEQVLEMIESIGAKECEFDDLPLRTQVGLIENFQGKIDRISASVLKSIKRTRLSAGEKIAEATKVKGIINGFEDQCVGMLNSTRYVTCPDDWFYNHIRNASIQPLMTRESMRAADAAADKATSDSKLDPAAESKANKEAIEG